MINELRNNIRTEIQIVREMADFVSRLGGASQQERKLITSMIESYKKRIKIINDSVPDILENISLIPRIPSEEKEERVHTLEVNEFEPKSRVKLKEGSKVKISLRKQDKDRFLEELSISEELIRKLQDKGILKGQKDKSYKRSKGYAHLSNSIFRNLSENLLGKGKFKGLRTDLKQSNLNILPTTYVSMMFFGILLSFFAGALLTLFFLFFSVSGTYPFISPFTGDFLSRAGQVFLILIGVPLVTILIFYFYPYTEKKSLGDRIDREIPFVAIHMASVSGSGIEPTQIFRILATSKEYPYTASELRKLLNQINVYGYDLVTSLKNLSNSTPSLKLSELFKGLATSIMTGGDLKAFLEKRAETLLLNYRLDREKFTKTAETFMDIYISVVIAAPMILLLLLVMISVSGISVGLGTGSMTIGIILIVAVVNILFLILLGMKQPGY